MKSARRMVVDERDERMMGIVRLAAEGTISCMDGARLTDVNRETFRLAVVAEKAKIAAKKAGGGE